MKSIFVVVLLALAQHTRAIELTSSIANQLMTDHGNNLNIPKLINDGDISDTYTSIGKDAFKNSYVESITIPKTVTSIGNDAFYQSNLGSITFEAPSSVTTIGEYAFGETLITAVSIPSSVTTIGESAFDQTYRTNPDISYTCKSSKNLLSKTCDGSYITAKDNNDAGVDGADFQSVCCASTCAAEKSGGGTCGQGTSYGSGIDSEAATSETFQSVCCEADNSCVGWKDYKTCTAGTSYKAADADAGEDGADFQSVCCEFTCAAQKSGGDSGGDKSCTAGTSYKTEAADADAGSNGANYQSVCCESCISVDTNNGDVDYCGTTIENIGLQRIKSALDAAEEGGLAFTSSCALE